MYYQRTALSSVSIIGSRFFYLTKFTGGIIMILRKKKIMDLTKIFRRDRVSLNVQDASKKLGVSIKTVYNYLYTHKLKGIKRDGHWRIPEDNLNKFKSNL